jgi:hypothetical protein
MPNQLLELRNLITVARSYIAGEIHFSYVCTATVALCDAVRYVPVGTRVKAMAAEWEEMATRVWPEMARINNRISEEEFRAWVSEQLAVFEPMDGTGGE